MRHTVSAARQKAEHAARWSDSANMPVVLLAAAGMENITFAEYLQKCTRCGAWALAGCRLSSLCTLLSILANVRNPFFSDVHVVIVVAAHASYRTVCSAATRPATRQNYMQLYDKPYLYRQAVFHKMAARLSTHSSRCFVKVKSQYPCVSLLVEFAILCSSTKPLFQNLLDRLCKKRGHAACSV